MDAALLFAEVLKLPAEGRTHLLDLIYASLEGPAASVVHESQLDELDKRWKAYEQGEVQALDGPEVMSRLMKRFAR